MPDGLLPVEELLAELARRARPKAKVSLAFLDDLHPKQRAFVEDPAKSKAALCSRRAGKSWGIACWLLEGGFDDPGGLSVYVARSKGNARLIIWPALDQINQRYKLGLKLREIDNQLMVQLPNGHRIWLAGAKDSSEVGKFRGPKYRRVAIDEAQEYGAYLREMVAEVFEPALLDKDGELCLTGTPAPVPAGLFYEATTGDGGPKWSTHTWTVLDNPHVSNAAEFLRRYREKYGIDENHPTYRREWLGEWVRDDGALVYPYSGALNAFDGVLPEGQYTYAIGVDLGVNDASAWVVAACRRGHPEVYVLEAWKKEGLIPSAVAAHCERFLKKYPNAQLVVDSGGLGKGYAEEMRQTYGIPAIPAQKNDKRGFQELVAGDLLAGVIRIDPHEKAARPLLDEIGILQWLPDKTAEDPRFENHAADAFLYAVRALRPVYRPELDPPKPGSPEWFAAERARERKAAQEAARKRSKRWRGVANDNGDLFPIAA